MKPASRVEEGTEKTAYWDPREMDRVALRSRRLLARPTNFHRECLADDGGLCDDGRVAAGVAAGAGDIGWRTNARPTKPMHRFQAETAARACGSREGGTSAPPKVGPAPESLARKQIGANAHIREKSWACPKSGKSVCTRGTARPRVLNS